MPLSEITQSDFRDAFALIWHFRISMATMAENRLKTLLDHSVALGLDASFQAAAGLRQNNGPTLSQDRLPEAAAAMDG